MSKAIAKETAKVFIRPELKTIVKTAGGILRSFHSTGLLAGSDPIFHEAPVAIFVTARTMMAIFISVSAEN